MSPRPGAEELREYYRLEFEQAYRNAGIEYIGGTADPPRYLRERLGRIEGIVGGPRVLLDVGAGGGAFAKYAKDRGWQVVGTEVSESAARRLRDRFGIDVLVGEISELGRLDEMFDVVHMNHVLEHLRDPLEDLACIRRMLKPDGILVVEVPHEFSDVIFLIRRWLGRTLADGVPTPHLWFFNPRTLRQIVGKSGFRVESLETRRECEDDWPRALVKRLVQVVEKRLEKGPLLDMLARKQ